MLAVPFVIVLVISPFLVYRRVVPYSLVYVSVGVELLESLLPQKNRDKKAE